MALYTIPYYDPNLLASATNITDAPLNDDQANAMQQPESRKTAFGMTPWEAAKGAVNFINPMTPILYGLGSFVGGTPSANAVNTPYGLDYDYPTLGKVVPEGTPGIKQSVIDAIAQQPTSQSAVPAQSQPVVTSPMQLGATPEEAARLAGLSESWGMDSSGQWTGSNGQKITPDASALDALKKSGVLDRTEIDRETLLPRGGYPNLQGLGLQGLPSHVESNSGYLQLSERPKSPADNVSLLGANGPGSGKDVSRQEAALLLAQNGFNATGVAPSGTLYSDVQQNPYPNTGSFTTTPDAYLEQRKSQYPNGLPIASDAVHPQAAVQPVPAGIDTTPGFFAAPANANQTQPQFPFLKPSASNPDRLNTVEVPAELLGDYTPMLGANSNFTSSDDLNTGQRKYFMQSTPEIRSLMARASAAKYKNNDELSKINGRINTLLDEQGAMQKQQEEYQQQEGDFPARKVQELQREIDGRARLALELGQRASGIKQNQAEIDQNLKSLLSDHVKKGLAADYEQQRSNYYASNPKAFQALKTQQELREMDAKPAKERIAAAEKAEAKAKETEEEAAKTAEAKTKAEAVADKTVVTDLKSRYKNAVDEHNNMVKQAMSDPTQVNNPNAQAMIDMAQKRKDAYAWKLHAAGQMDLPLPLLMQARSGAAQDVIRDTTRQRGQVLSREERVKIANAFASGQYDDTPYIKSYIPHEYR